jgi:two-component sensor histidine kinase/streptogramin lyase
MGTVSQSYRLLIAFIFLSLLSMNICAQEIVERNMDRQYVLSNWDNTNGLPQNTVFNITTDSVGYLWLVTEEGFVRFDGMNFKLYDETNTPGLVSSYFVDIESSSESGIWAASQRDIVRVQNQQISAFHLADYSNDQITNIAEGSDGRLWAGTNTGQLFVVENDSLKWVENWEAQELGSIIKVEARTPFIYVGTHKGLYKINDLSGEITPLPLFQQKFIRSIFITEEHELWIGTADHGAFHLSEKGSTQYTTKDGFLENNINDIVVNHEGEVWAATASSGLYKLENSVFAPVSDFENLEDDIRSVHISAQGIIWLGTTGSGLTQLKPADIYTLPNSYTLSSSIILPIYQHKKGEIWIGTAGSGLNRLNGETITHYSRDDGLTNEIILSIYGTENYIYVGTANGLNRFNLQSNTFDRSYSTDDGLASNVIQSIFESTQGVLWVATREGGLHKIADDKIEQVELPAVLKTAAFLSIYEDTQKNLWLGTNGIGAMKLSRNGNINVYTNEEGLPTNIVYHFYEDKEGSVWLSTAQGLSVITGDTLFSFNKSNGLRSNEIYHIAEDNNGFLWMSSNSGLQRINNQEFLEAKIDPNYQFSTQLFTQNNGMPNSEANGGIFPAAWTMQNGDIWFPTVSGIAIVNPSLLVNAEQSVNVQFEALRFAGKEITGEENISIPAGITSVEVDYTSIDFLRPEDIKYAYRINELSDVWTNVNDQRSIHLAIQNPGTYTLEIKAEKPGVGTDIAVQSFTVQPFFHQTGWFQFIALAFLFGLGYLVNQLRHKAKRSDDLKKMVDIKTKDLKIALSEKDVLLQEVHHRVKNNLAIISGLLQIQQFDSEDEALNKILGNSVTRIKSLALIHEKLYQSESLSNIEFQSYLKDSIRSIKQSSPIYKDIDIHIECEKIMMNVNQAVPCALILNEVVSNALEHAFHDQESGNIWVCVNKSGDEVTFSVKDDGIGISEQDYMSSAGIGTTIINTLIKQLNAHFEILNKEGTNVIFSFQLQDIQGAHSHKVI